MNLVGTTTYEGTTKVADALFEDQRSKDWNAKFKAKDEAWKLEKIM